VISDEIKARVYDRIMVHLNASLNDRRNRERRRVRVAMKKLNQWLKEVIREDTSDRS